MAGSGSRLWWIVAVFACVPLAGCGDPAPETSNGDKPGAASAPRKRPVGENMVAAVTAGKSASVVGVYFALGNAPTVDTALPIDVAIVPHQDFTSLQARYVTQGDALTLVSGDSVPATAGVKAESILEHKLVVMPKKEGVFTVTVNIETEGSDGSVSRIFSIPVIVSPAGGATAPAPAEAPPAPAAN